MPYYNGNAAYYRESTAGTPYHTYAGDEHSDLIVPGYRYTNDYQGNVLQERFHRRPPHISNLRTILSETIANVTKGNQLQKGESVELTLEIELMRTKNNTPTNSLVEVTIIQHNKSREQATIGCEVGKYLTNKMPFQVEVLKSRSESPSEKRRNWFQRVITKPYIENTITNTNERITTHEIATIQHNKNDKQNKDKNKSKNPRSNFVTILPEESPLSIHYSKGYQRVSPPHLKLNKLKNRVTPRKDTLVKKLSNIFLPTRNADKSQAVQSALTALKQEVDSMKLAIDKDKNNQNGIERKNVPVQNLGKLVSKILVDAMEKSDEANKIKNNTNIPPVCHKICFEPVPKSKEKRLEKNVNERKPQHKVKMIAESHSDTCCFKPLYTTSEPSLQTSISMSDCRSLMEAKSPIENFDIGDSTNISSKVKYSKSSRENKYSKDHKRNAKGDAGDLGKKELPKDKHKKIIRSKKSVVNWGGHIIQINKKKKSRIEHLIVNELQNLALKEGMECDVLPLPSVEDGIKHKNTVGKIASFICDLDISDKAFEKEIRKRTSLDKTVNRPLRTGLERIQRFYTNNKGHGTKLKKARKVGKEASKAGYNWAYHDSEKNTVNFDRASKSFTIAEQLKINTVQDESKMYFNDREDNEVKITYLNKNIKNWSAESTVVHFESPNMKCSQNTESTSTETQTDKHAVVSTGFVKVIKSDDSTWHRYLRDQEESGSGHSTQIMTVTSTETAIKFHSGNTDKFEKNIELEVDIKDLELILKEAKKKQNSDRYVINAKWNGANKKRKKQIRMTGKNSPAYTNQLLSNAAEKLENYIGIKHKQR